MKTEWRAEVIKWMEKLPAEATDHPPPAIAVAAAFAELKNWSRLRRWTRSESWGDDDYLRLAYQGFAAHQSRQVGRRRRIRHALAGSRCTLPPISPTTN